MYSHHDRSGEATVGPVSLQGVGIVDGVSSVAKLLLQRIQADSPPSQSLGLDHSKWLHGLLKRHLKPRGNFHRRAAPEGACDPARPQAVASSSQVTADKLAAVVTLGLSVSQAVALGFLPSSPSEDLAAGGSAQPQVAASPSALPAARLAAVTALGISVKQAIALGLLPSGESSATPGADGHGGDQSNRIGATGSS